MPEATVALLSTWQGFYQIIGEAAATLTGLLFVVVTLIERLQTLKTNEGVSAFSTPNIVHFCAALFVAAAVNAPWPVLWNVSIPLGLCGLGGVVYVAIVGWRVHRQTSYQPVLEDWLWHAAFPLASYAALVFAAILLPFNATPALFIIGAAALLLLFIGIHNAWDTLTYIALVRPQPENKPQDE
jgi:hypothetical protein